MVPMLNRRVVLEARVATPDGGGGETLAWVERGTLWAAFRPSRGREGLVGGREATTVTHRVTVRSAPVGSPRRPEAADRLRLGARVFDIHGVAEEGGDGAFLTLWVTEGSLT